MRKLNKILLKEFASEAADLGKKEGTFTKDIHKYILIRQQPVPQTPQNKAKNNP